jgi:hypothetical protein
MLWIGGAQGAGKSTLCWQLSRASDLPLHPADLWAYDHQARLPVGDTLDDQLARGPDAPRMPSSPSANSAWDSCSTTSSRETWAPFPRSSRARS